MMILSCYPDYGKAPPEYAVNITDVLASFPEWAMVKLCNLREGIPAKCKFLPTVADIVQMGDAIIAARQFTEETERLRQEAADVAEAHRVWWEGRLLALEKAKKKYPDRDVFLANDGALMARAVVIAPAPKPKGEEEDYSEILRDHLHSQPLN